MVEAISQWALREPHRDATTATMEMSCVFVLPRLYAAGASVSTAHPLLASSRHTARYRRSGRQAAQRRRQHEARVSRA